MADVVEIDVSDRVAHVVLNRPEKHNAINVDMFRSLAAVGDRIAEDRSIRAVVLAGAGDNFCAGIDTSVFTDGALGDVSEAMQAQSPSPANVFQRAAYVWREVPVPVICALSGAVFGGGLQIALGADIRYAAPGARMSVMEIKWGLIPDMAISVTARQVVPLDRLRELAYTGRIVSGEEGLALGLVTALHDDPLAAARQTAATIAAGSPDAIRAMKRLLNEAWRASEADSLALEARLQSSVMGGPNQLEAVQANIEKRAPDFQD